MDAIRIIRQMRTATGGKCPRFAVWENVPGAFSSNKGEDFRAVLSEIAETEIPMPPSGKWATAGMVRTERVDVAWRTLDAQHWGVPQRRKRIFLVADFRGQCAGEILFESSCVSWNPKTSGEKGEEVATHAEGGPREPGSLVLDEIAGCLDSHYFKGPGMRAGVERTFVATHTAPAGISDKTAGGNSVTATITASYGTKWNGNSGADTGDNFVMQSPADVEGGSGKQSGIIPFDTTQITSPQNGNNPKPNDPCHPLRANAHVPSIAIPQTSYWDGGQISDCLDCSMLTKGQMMPEKRRFPAVIEPRKGIPVLQMSQPTNEPNWDVSPPLLARMGTGGNQVPVMLAFAANQRDEVRDLGDKLGALQAEPGIHQQTYVCIEPGALSRGQGERVWDKCPTLRANMGDNQPCVVLNDQGGSQMDVSDTLNTTDRHAVAYGFDGYNQITYDNISQTLKAHEGGDSIAKVVYGICSDGSNSMKSSNHYAVRRLTPLETERLQGLPDGWTNIPPQTEVTAQDLAFWRTVWDTWDDINEKKHHSDNQIKSWLHSEAKDTARYKAVGNSVAIPCVEFVMAGIVRVIGGVL